MVGKFPAAPDRDRKANLNHLRANIELISLIGNGNATSTKLDTVLSNSMFINGIALNIQADAANDLSNCEETILGIMKYSEIIVYHYRSPTYDRIIDSGKSQRN